MRELAPSEVLVGAVTTQPLVSIAADSGASDAAALMHSSGVRRLLVVDGNGEISGLLSSDDGLDSLLAPLQLLADALRVNITREEILTSEALPHVSGSLFLPPARSPVRA